MAVWLLLTTLGLEVMLVACFQAQPSQPEVEEQEEEEEQKEERPGGEGQEEE